MSQRSSTGSLVARAGMSPATIIVGAGLMGRWHAAAVRHAGGRVAAIVDPDTARGSTLARRHSGASSFGALEPALEAIGAGVVHLCSPRESHAPLALTALRGGCHVLIEKPFAGRHEDALEVLSVAESVGRLASPVHQFLYQPGALHAAAVVRDLGTLLHLEAEVCSTGAEHGAAGPDEVALEILPHALSFAARFCSESIDSVPWSHSRSAPGELTVRATVGPTMVSARLSMRGRPPVNGIRLVAERGTIHLDLFHGFAIVDRSGSSRLMKVARPAYFSARLALAASGSLARRVLQRETAYPGLRELVRRFYAAAATGATSPISPEETRAVSSVWSVLNSRVIADVR